MRFWSGQECYEFNLARLFSAKKVLAYKLFGILFNKYGFQVSLVDIFNRDTRSGYYQIPSAEKLLFKICSLIC